MKSSEKDLTHVGSKESLQCSDAAAVTSRQNGDDSSGGLPTEFVNYLRSLFEILDQENTGYVKITDIESYWDAKGSSFSGVLDSLKTVAPSNGLLSFGHLCRGLKLAIRSSTSKTTTTTSCTKSSSKLTLQKESDSHSDSSEDSFKVHDDSKDLELAEKTVGLQKTSSSREEIDTLPINLSNTNLTQVKTNSTSKVYFVGKPENSEGLRGGSQKEGPSIDKKTRSTQVEEEIAILKSGLNAIEKARKWYFRRITAVQEEKLHLQQSDHVTLEQFQYEMLLHNTRRKELNLNEATFRCYKRNIAELNNYITKLVENPLEPLAPPPKYAEASKPPPEYVQQLRDDIYTKSNRIAQLEREKSALIRDLFNAKATVKGSKERIPSAEK